MLGLLDSELYGLYHMACGGEGSRYDVAARILRGPRPRRRRAGPGRLGVLRRGVLLGPARLGDHAQHGARSAGHEHDARVAGGASRTTSTPSSPTLSTATSASPPDPAPTATGIHPMTTLALPRPADQAGAGADSRSVCVVIPMPERPALGPLRRHPGRHPDHRQRRQRRPARSAARPGERLLLRLRRAAGVRGRHYAAMPHKSAASRNIGHYIAWKEGFDVIVALDYDCRTRPGWLARTSTRCARSSTSRLAADDPERLGEPHPADLPERPHRVRARLPLRAAHARAGRQQPVATSGGSRSTWGSGTASST